MTRSLLALFLLGFATQTASAAADPVADRWAAHLTPRMLRQLGETHTASGVTVKRVIFASYRSELFAEIAVPPGPGPFPGLLVLHGGGGAAETDKAVAWAEHGYLAVAPDLPSIASPTKVPDSSGPWKALAYGKGRFQAHPDATANAIFDAVTAGIDAFRLLQAQPAVDRARIGITGISWGGYLTTMLAGVTGAETKAVFSVFGCGNYDRMLPAADLERIPPAERERWLAALDPARRMSGLKANYFIAAATDDFFFWPPGVEATLGAIRGHANQVYAPNVTHKIPLPGGTFEKQRFSWLAMEQPYFDWQLKHVGAPFPEAKPAGVLRFTATGPRPITRSEIYYSVVDGTPWTKRVWARLPVASAGAGTYAAARPAIGAAAFDWFGVISDDRPVSVSTRLQHVAAQDTGAAVDWPSYLGGDDRAHYSGAGQITGDKVAKLRVAWTFHTGDPGESQCSPIEREGVVYGVTATGAVYALDAVTGIPRWTFAPPGPASRRTVRGVACWAEGGRTRLFVTVGSDLYALDAADGRPIADFGDHGSVSLRTGLGPTATEKWIASTSPGTVCGDVIVMPTRVTETADAALGWIQAFDVRTGKLAWVFHTIPLPGEPGYETWPTDAYRNQHVGSANCWAGMAYDAARGLIFVPTGSASPDFWGGDRVGSDLYANCLLALDARTGALRWHFQFVHHDLWDRDLPSPPSLVRVRHDGRVVDAVAQTAKFGRVFVFDRDTGQSLFPIHEAAVPKSDLPGQVTSPTQPTADLPEAFSRQALGPDEINPNAPHPEALRARLQAARRGRYLPFTVGRETVLIPGFDGGAEWGGAAVDPAGILYVNANEIAWMARLKPPLSSAQLAGLTPGGRLYATYCAVCHGPNGEGNPKSGFPALAGVGARRSRADIVALLTTGKGMMPGFAMLDAADKGLLADKLLGTEKTEGSGHTSKGAQSPYNLDGYVKFLDDDGYPASPPPWGSLSAVDLNTGKRLWHVPLGEFAALTAKGIPPTGTQTYGGPLVTASGLLFIASTEDAKFRAFDTKTGKVVWQTDLPACGFATPCTYERDGKQYIVLSCGGGKLNTPTGDSVVAFALP